MLKSICTILGILVSMCGNATIDVNEIDLEIKHVCNASDLGSLEVDVNDQNVIDYSIDNVNFQTSSIFSELTSGPYILYLRNNDCLVEIPVDIRVIQEPDIIVRTSRSCTNMENGSINITGDTTGLEYSLDSENFSDDAILENLGVGEYQLTIRVDNSCTFLYNLEIRPLNIPGITLDDKSACENASNGALMVDTQDTTLLYSIDNINYQTLNVIFGLSQGMYTVYVKDTFGCVYTLEGEVLTTTPITVEFNEPEISCETKSVELQVTPSSPASTTLYKWSTGNSGDKIEVKNSGTYTVDVFTNCDSIRHQWDIQFDEPSEDDIAFYPTAFSPNGDFINDRFVATFSEDISILGYRFEVYDRWGNIIHTSKDFINGWDGFSGNHEVIPGIYQYHAFLVYTYCVEPLQSDVFGSFVLVK